MMPKYLELGYDSIDVEHNRLFVALAKFIKNFPPDVAHKNQAVRQLSDYLIDHFLTEQNEMEIHQYPFRVEHHNSHIELNADWSRVILDPDPPGLIRIQNDLIDHIDVYDRRLVGWLLRLPA